MRGVVCPIAVLLVSLAVSARGNNQAVSTSQPADSPDRLATITASLRAAMQRPISVDLRNEPLDRAVGLVLRRTLVPISVDWDAFRSAGIARDTAVSLQMDGVRGERVLALLFRCAKATGPAQPVFSYHAGGIHVTPAASAGSGENAAGSETVEANGAGRTIQVTYDVSDLLGIAARASGSRHAVYDDLTRLIEDSVAPDTWMDYGGTVGRIRVGLAEPREEGDEQPPPPPRPPRRSSSKTDPSDDPLVVTTTADLQDQVAALLSKLRDALAGRDAVRSTAHDRAARALARPVAPALKPVRVEAALESWRGAANVNLFVDWDELEAAGVSRSTLLTLPMARGSGLSARQVLSGIVNAASNQRALLSFDVDSDGVVTVSTEDALSRVVEVRCYDVRPWLATHRPVGHWTAGEDPLFALKKLIVDKVEADSWKENGGTAGDIKVFGWVMIVSQISVNQEKVAAIVQGTP